MVKSKIDSYVGFCLRSRKIALGSGAIDALKGGVFLLIADATAAKNSQKLAVKFKNRFSCPLVLCKSGFETLVKKGGCKIAAIKDLELSKAILANLDETFELYSGGNV